MKKRILIFACLLAVINLYGQQSAPGTSPEQAPSANETKTCNSKHEISVWGAGGFSTLYYKPTFGDWSPKLGGAFGLGYTFYFSKHFGILAGGELTFYNAKMEVDGLIDNFDTADPKDGRDVNYRTNFNGYEETQHLMNVNIPVAFQFQTAGKHKFFASLGFKLGIPVSGKYKQTEYSTLEASGYYPEWNQELFDPGYLGYGTFRGKEPKSDIDFGLSYMGTIELGIKWKLSRVLSLYTGLYGEYGFNDITKAGHNDRFLIVNSADPANFTTNSTLTSQYTNGTREGEFGEYVSSGKTESFVSRVSPAAAGVKIRLGMNFCKKEKDKTPEPAPAPKPEPTPAPVVKPEPAPEEPKPLPKPIAPPRKTTDEFERTLSDEEIIENLHRLVFEYGSVKGVIGVPFGGDDILAGYDLDQSSLSPNMKRILDGKIAEIKSKYGADVTIITEGHTCTVGNEAYNLKLGQRRAEVVRQYLIEKGGFNPAKITAISKGQAYPIAPNDNEANRKKNRRVVIIIK